jgi:hypothetical protein
LLHNGYVDNAFKDTIKKVSRKSVTVWHSTERIEKIQKAITHDNLSHATEGGQMKNDAMAENWKEILQSEKDEPIFIKLSADNEVNLPKLTSESVTLVDTAVGRHQQIMKRQVNNVVPKISREEREDLK